MKTQSHYQRAVAKRYNANARKFRVVFTLGTSQPQCPYSRNLFLSIARVHGALLLKTVKLRVFFFTNKLTPTDKGKDGTKVHGQERTHCSELKNSLQPVTKVVETSYLNERKLFTVLSRVIFFPSPPLPNVTNYGVQNLDGQQ